MLGEIHSLVNEFPEHQDLIVKLTATNNVFAKDGKHYNALDRQIRKLELRGAPIADEEMYRLKHDRAELKDTLYQRIVDAQNS